MSTIVGLSVRVVASFFSETLAQCNQNFYAKPTAEHFKQLQDAMYCYQHWCHLTPADRAALADRLYSGTIGVGHWIERLATELRAREQVIQEVATTPAG